MTRHSVTLTVRRPGPIARWVYRRHGRTVPTAATPPAGSEILGAALPYRWRRAHHWLATGGGYFWLPCPTCGREFGGHEAGDLLHMTDSGGGFVSCTDCTRKANQPMTGTFRVRVDQCRFPLHGLNPAHIWPAPGTTLPDGPIRLSRLDSGEWFVQDGRHRVIRAHLNRIEWIDATDHDQPRETTP